MVPNFRINLKIWHQSRINRIYRTRRITRMKWTHGFPLFIKILNLESINCEWSCIFYIFLNFILMWNNKLWLTSYNPNNRNICWSIHGKKHCQQNVFHGGTLFAVRDIRHIRYVAILDTKVGITEISSNGYHCLVFDRWVFYDKWHIPCLLTYFW